MKAKEVMQILRISNPTLSHYVKKGWIKTTTMPNGRYDYDEESVYAFLNAGIPRKVYVYAKVSSPDRRSNLEEQINLVKQFCFNSGVQINGIFQDVTSEQTVDLEFFTLFDEVVARKVKTVYVAYDRVFGCYYRSVEIIFNKFGTRLVVVQP